MSGRFVECETLRPDVCPRCGGSDVSSAPFDLKFEYGVGDNEVELTAVVMLHECGACGFGFLDNSAEDAKHRAVCGHLGVLPPERVRQIRESFGLSQKDFAEITGFGVASLTRWETGAGIQSRSNDKMLRMLEDRQARNSLLRLQRVHTQPREPRFRALGSQTASLRREQEAFCLRVS